MAESWLFFFPSLQSWRTRFKYHCSCQYWSKGGVAPFKPMNHTCASGRHAVCQSSTSERQWLTYRLWWAAFCFVGEVQGFVRLVLLSPCRDARPQVPITHHPCGVISINYDKKVIYTTRMTLFSSKHSIKFGMLAESQANITYYSCYLVHLGLHLQAQRFVTA